MMLLEQTDLFLNLPIMLSIPLAAGLIGGKLFAKLATDFLKPKQSLSRFKLTPGRARATAAARSANKNALTQLNIRRAGAAGRAPPGAVLSSLAGANINANRVDPSVEQAELGVQRFNAGLGISDERARVGRGEDLQSSILQGFGAFGRIALLKKAGLLGGGQGVGQPGQVPTGGGSNLEDLLARLRRDDLGRGLSQGVGGSTRGFG